MWNDRLRLTESVEAQWKLMNETEQVAVMRVLELIDEDPIAGAPLLDPMRGYWSFRSGPMRIVYKIMPEARLVAVLDIGFIAWKQS